MLSRAPRLPTAAPPPSRPASPLRARRRPAPPSDTGQPPGPVPAPALASSSGPAPVPKAPAPPRGLSFSYPGVNRPALRHLLTSATAPAALPPTCTCWPATTAPYHLHQPPSALAVLPGGKLSTPPSPFSALTTTRPSEERHPPNVAKRPSSPGPAVARPRRPAAARRRFTARALSQARPPERPARCCSTRR